jgi:hypothetical protein
MATREQLRSASIGPDTEDGDFNRVAAVPYHQVFLISEAIINGLMEDDRPHFKKPRAGVEQRLKNNLDAVFPDLPPFTVTFETDNAGDDERMSSFTARNPIFRIVIDYVDFGDDLGIESTSEIHKEEGTPIMNDDVINIHKAIKLSSRGIDIKKERKKFAVEKLTERVGDIMAEKGAPADPLMLQKEVGKYLGGKRRKTKKSRSRVFKNPKTLKKTIR